MSEQVKPRNNYEPKRSAYSGNHCTHVQQRDDAVIHNSRDYVPTIYGQSEGNTIWVDTLETLRAVGGTICWNEDQTEIHFMLPVGHKFGISMFREVNTREALKASHTQLVNLVKSIVNRVENSIIDDGLFLNDEAKQQFELCKIVITNAESLT